MMNTQSLIQFGTSPNSLKQSVVGFVNPFVDGGSLHRTIYVHHGFIQNLLPSTQYFYRVGDGQKWSEIFSFKTLPPKNQNPIKIAMYGDMVHYHVFGY